MMNISGSNTEILHSNRPLYCSDSLFAMLNSSDKNMNEFEWEQHNSIVYVKKGSIRFYDPGGLTIVGENQCVLLKKGRAMPAPLIAAGSVYILCCLPDDFLCNVLKTGMRAVCGPVRITDPVIELQYDEQLHAFFYSLMPYFSSMRQTDKTLLELKFRELVLMLAGNLNNTQLRSYCCALLQQPQVLSLQQAMENNFRSNLRLEDFARLSFRSLSSFKRDFIKIYDTSPGKWLLQKRLDHALLLLTSLGKSVADAAFEAGFESPSHFSRVFRSRFGHSPGSIKQRAIGCVA